MRIGSRHIGHGLEPYVIAEIGVNHDGSVERALNLVESAREAGADAVKLQLFRAGLLMSRASGLAGYQKDAGESDAVAMLRRLEMSGEQMKPVVERARALGLHAIVTVFSVDLVGEAERVGFDAYKTASPDIINRPLIDALLKTGRALILSTGAATEPEVARAVSWLGPAVERSALLQCVSSYPTPPGQAALGGIAALRELSALPVGYSDHTEGEQTGGLAVAAGACVLEKHLTYDRGAAGPDHAASLDVTGFARYVRGAREAFDMLGREKKCVLEVEEDVRRVSRQSVVTARALPAGHVIGRGDVTVKRPGAGIEPWRMAEVVGRVVARGLEADVPVGEGDLR